MADTELPVEPADPSCPRCGKPRERVESPHMKPGTVALVCWGCYDELFRSRSFVPEGPPEREWGLTLRGRIGF